MPLSSPGPALCAVVLLPLIVFTACTTPRLQPAPAATTAPSDELLHRNRATAEAILTREPVPTPKTTVATPTPINVLSYVMPPASVTIRDGLSPAQVTVDSGEWVTWTNASTATHHLRAAAASLDSGDLVPGATFTWQAAQPGLVEYACLMHPWLSGQVRVLPRDEPPSLRRP